MSRFLLLFLKMLVFQIIAGLKGLSKGIAFAQR